MSRYITLRELRKSNLYKSTWPKVKAVHGHNADWTLRALQGEIHNYTRPFGDNLAERVGRVNIQETCVSRAFTFFSSIQGNDFWLEVYRYSGVASKSSAKKRELEVLI